MTAPESAHRTRTLLEAPLVRDQQGLPLQRQLYQRLRQAILDGMLLPGSRLPGSRALAETLAVSRNTVTAAYEQLVAEGFLQPEQRGTKVVELSRHETRPALEAPPSTARRLAPIRSCRFQPEDDADFRPGVPALSHFPLTAWRQGLDRTLRAHGPSLLGYGDPQGEPALRASIARHLALTRGVRCAPRQIIITEGTQDALTLCVQLLTNPGDRAWIEDPGYRGAKTAMHSGDLQVYPIRVDGEGIRTSADDWRTHPPRLIYTTPSHQYPSGAVLSVARRLALIEAARRHGAWIIEDDYDSEFRHSGAPIVAMQGLEPQAPVLYVGTFSKTMFPALRLGFLVLPDEVLTAVRPALAEMLRGGNRSHQLALADFIESGQYGRHLGRMRRLYRERQQALRAALSSCLLVPHDIVGGHAGLHLTVRLPLDYPDQEIAAAAQRQSIALQPLSDFAIRRLPQDNGLVLGYGNTSSDKFEPLLSKLSSLILAMARINPPDARSVT